MNDTRYTLVLVILAVLLALAGMVVSGILLQHHVVARIGGDPLLGGVCRAAASFDCDEVIASKWGRIELPWGDGKVIVPTAMLGFAYFAAIASWYIAVGVPRVRGRRLHWVPTLALVVGVLGAAFFEYVMFFVLHKQCPLCIVTHVCILLLLVLTVILWWVGRPQAGGAPQTPGATSAGMPGWQIVIAVLLAGTTSGLGWYMYQARLHQGYADEYFARWQDYDQDVRLNYDRFLAQPRINIPIDPEDPIRGPVDAKHTVVVFSDFMCPACQALDITVLEPRLKEFPDQFRIVFKHFPLDQRCNPELKRTLHQGACAGAVAAEAVRLLKGNDAFWTIHDAFFHNPGRFTEEFAFKEAAELGIARDTYKQMFLKTSTWNHINVNIAEGRRLGLDATPAIYFDGRPLKPWGDRHLWRYLLSDETLTSSATQPAGGASQPASEPATQAGE